MRKFVLIFTLLIYIHGFTQQVFWAKKVITCSSEYSKYRNSAQEILGVPNVDPQGRPSPYAWAVKPNSLNKEGVDWAYIDVGFDSVLHNVRQIAVFESYNPGAISMILVNPLQDDTTHWQLVYFNKGVVERTGLPRLPGVPDSLYRFAGVKKRRFFPPDRRFKPKAYSNILHVFLKQPQIISRVRIVLNPLAIDGWNEIDAVGLSKSLKPITYPQVHTLDASFILEPEPQNIGSKVNTPAYELAPVVYPDGKLLFYTKDMYLKKISIYTQNIWISERKTIKIHRRPKVISHETYNKTVWWTGKPVDFNLNTLLPNAVVGFSSDGQYMYLSNLYPQKNKYPQAFFEDNRGLSYCHLDTVVYQLLDSQQVKKFSLDTFFDAYFMDPQKQVLLAPKLDTVDSIVNVFLLTNKGKGQWSSPIYLGRLNEHKFMFDLKIKGKKQTFWIQIDSLGIKKYRVVQLNWSRPVPVEFEDFQNYSNYTSYYIVPEYGVMFLAIEDSSSLGHRDLYVSYYDTIKHKWTKPVNLGLPINTLGDETSPFLDGDGRTLFFASNGHPGYGGYDIYVSFRKGQGWTQWSEPLNLGPIINSPGDELDFKIDQTTRDAYYISTSKALSGQIESDIYKIRVAKPVTLHFKGVTRNCARGGAPCGNVKVIFKPLGSSGNLLDTREITFYSNLDGKFDVKITRFIDANKLGKFAYLAKKDTFPQCDENCNVIPYIELDLSAKDKWTFNIYQDLYLRGKPPIIVTADTTKIAQQPGFEVVHQNITPEERKQIQKQTQPTGHKGKMFTQNIYVPGQCTYMYFNGQLYIVTLVSPKDSLYSLNFMRVAYYNEYQYNETEFDTHTPLFKNLVNSLLGVLGTNDTATVLIMASASDVPTSKYVSNLELARLRAEQAKQAILNVLQKANIDPSRVRFQTKFMVEGQVYRGDAQNVEKYKPYQYIKIWVFRCKNKKQ